MINSILMDFLLLNGGHMHGIEFCCPNIHKVLYLDCDIVVNDSLDSLFAMDMGNKSVAGCVDVQHYSADTYERLEYSRDKGYICSGVLMMNLDKWREKELSARITEYSKQNSNKILFPAQDAINYVCQDDKIILSPRFGVLVPFCRHKEFMLEHKREMEELMDSPAIVHYAGYQPWIYCKNKSMHSYLWWSAYDSLQSFKEIKITYYGSMFRYMLRYVLSVTHVFPKNSRLHINQYYNHPRIKKTDVIDLMKTLNI